MTRLLPALMLSAATLSLAACSSSNPDEAPTPPTVVNQPPVFTSPSAVSVPENTEGTFYTATATDPDSPQIRFRFLPSGADSILFDIDRVSGEIAFLDAPDFETPADANADNVYEVDVLVEDVQGASSTLLLRVTVTDEVAAARFKPVGTDFASPVFLTGLGDGSGRVMVFERGGLIRLLDPETGVTDSVPFLDVSGSITSGGERGLLGGALAPDFATSGQVYINVTNPDGDTEIRRYGLMSGRTDMADPATEDVILRIAQPRANHNAGWIGFDARGNLVVPTGDGGGAGDPDNLSQDPQSLLGKVLRLDVGGDDFADDDARDYRIPDGNAFADAADGRPEIFALGLRNPFRASFAPDGQLLIGDVGQAEREEISRLDLSDDGAGTNFGWNVIEGTLPFRGSTTDTLTPPVIELEHGDGPANSNSITGGYVYSGPVEALQDDYVFGDFRGAMFSVPLAQLQDGTTLGGDDITVQTEALTPEGGLGGILSSFATDDSGNLYVMSLGGSVFRLEAD